MRAEYDKLLAMPEAEVEDLLKPCLDIKKDEEIVEKKESTNITFYAHVD